MRSLLAVLIVFALLPLYGQQASQNPNAIGSNARVNSLDPAPIRMYPVPTIRKRVNEVDVVFTVTDKHGDFINDLSQQDIAVLDDNKTPTEITSFRAETDLPLRVGLLVDTSDSIRSRFKFEQDAAIDFLKNIVRPATDKVLVLGFDTTAEITQEFTSNQQDLANGIRELRPGGSTALFDAIYYTCRDRLLRTERPGTVRRTIILISDGDDTYSMKTEDEALEMAERAQVTIFAISTNDTGLKKRGDKVLKRFAAATGGRVFYPSKGTDVKKAFSKIEDELRSEYLVSYKPQDLIADGRFRTIKITVPEKKKLKVTAKQGYFAPSY